jgi:TFIIF-interacting CTD phosphatase-like protein
MHNYYSIIKMSHIHIFLDLDNTLIHSLYVDEYNRLSTSKQLDLKKKYKWHRYNNYYIFERPGLQKFLDYIFSRYNVSVWTAATKCYASFIIKNFILIKPERKLLYFFWRSHCHISKRFYNNDKCLKLLTKKFNLPFNINNIYLIDDNIDICKPQKKCLSIKKFKVLKENDNFLVDMKNKLDNIIK